MNLINEPLPGVKILRPFIFEDFRGNFVKPYHENQLSKHGIEFSIREEFFSTSAMNVLRGMHFQTPPHAHQKLIYCIRGKVSDVLLDLRKESPTFGKSVALELSDTNHHVLFLPIGIAHGFLTLKDNSCLIYKTDTVHNPESDKGILWNSFGHDWQIQPTAAILSERDLNHPEYTAYISPF
jgi:dTDP-4-dehydrorhamnose 3,5-epimerase/CDP-3, 6-dideoxy-D-glycero-D-glycero-4-hexulose-5-epimerase